MEFWALLLLVLLPVAAEQETNELLKFNPGGKFKILQVADMHYADGAKTKCLDVPPHEFSKCSDLNTTAFVKRMIALEKPDLIVFTGDNIFAADSSNSIVSLNGGFSPAVEAKIPWAAVLGNHDQESALTRSGVMSHIVAMDYTYSQYNPSDIDIDGFGNYVLNIHGVAGSQLDKKSILNLYLVDSGDYSTNPSIPGYGWVKPSQQAWLKQTSAELQKAYKGGPFPQAHPAPALTYFHIPVPEVDNLTSSDIVGVKQEGVGSAKFNSGFFATLNEMGDVKATFTGHDHLNDFCGKLKGLHLCYGGGFGYHAYGKVGWQRRARVIEASVSKDKVGDVEEITTWKRLDDELLTSIDKQVLWKKD